MKNHTLIPSTLQTPLVSYRMLNLSAMVDESARTERDTLLKDFEIDVARAILRWFGDHPDYMLLLDWIMAVPYRGTITAQHTQHIRAPLWGATNAQPSLKRYDVGTYTDVLWQMAIVRLSAFLNTGSYETDAIVEGKAW